MLQKKSLSCTWPAAVPSSGMKGRMSQKEEGDKNLGIILQKNRSFSSIISHSNHSNFRWQFVQRALCPPSLFHYDPMVIAIWLASFILLLSFLIPLDCQVPCLLSSFSGFLMKGMKDLWEILLGSVGRSSVQELIQNAHLFIYILGHLAYSVWHYSTILENLW